MFGKKIARHSERSEESVIFLRIATHTCGMLAMTNVGNGLDRSVQPSQRGRWHAAGVTDEGLSSNPEGNLPLMREVSPQVTEGEKSYPIKFSQNYGK